MSSKKITYSSDFKLKVLDYYFKHGGDDKFGLKKKTAGHFNIDKKTINRMLNNPDMVKRARKVLAARKSAGSTKPPPSSTRHPVKPAVRRAGATQNKTSTATSKAASSSQSSASSSSNTKASTSSTSSTKTVSSSSRHQVNSTTSNSNKTTPIKSKLTPHVEKGAPGVEVFELPEDPDYSLLKRSINSSTNGVASLAKLLVTGTEEVRNVVLNECDVILECKVCRNLFRSIINFLAHKRIYCQEEFADVRTLFHKGDVQGVTSQSNTIVVEPEPPPENDNFPTMKTSIPTTLTSPLRSAAPGRTRHSGIDSIALKLARKRKAYHASALSSPTNAGSSSYFGSLSEVSRTRDKLSRDCSVVLEDISGVTNAVFQSFAPPDSASPSTSMSSKVDEAANSKTGLTVAINQNGDIVKTAPGNVTSMDIEPPSVSSDLRDLTCLLCNTRFATQKTLSVHQRSHHGMERCIYSCPICQASFLSMWAVVKHLQRTHKKTKSQVERLRKVVRKNVRKKMIYQNVDKDKNASDHAASVDDDNDDNDNDENEVEDSNDSSARTSEEGTSKKCVVNIPMQATPVKASPHKDDEYRPTGSPDHRCVKCERKFSTPCALESHDKFCSLMPILPPESKINPLLRSETPEKKIAIQIRKDYKKSVTSFDPSAPNISESKYTQVMFKIPKTPQERENQFKIEEMMAEFCDLPSMSCIPCGRRYQTVTTLKRHAAWHIDWTRFECNLCQHRNYHRYEVINHCIVKHNVKESIAGGMVTEVEFVGQLKYFLDNEDATQDSPDLDQDQSEEHYPPINEDVLDNTHYPESKQPTKEEESTTQPEKEEAPVADASNQPENEAPATKISDREPNELPEIHGEDSSTIVDKNSECKMSALKDEDLRNAAALDGYDTKLTALEDKDMETTVLKSEMKPVIRETNIHLQSVDNQMETSTTGETDICHQSIDKSGICDTSPNKLEESTTQLEKIVGSGLKSTFDECRKYVQKLSTDASLHIGVSEVSSQNEKDKKSPVREADDGTKVNDTEKIGEDDRHSICIGLNSNSEKSKTPSKESILDEACIGSQGSEVPKKESSVVKATDFGKLLGISTYKLKKESDCSTSTGENSSLPFDCCTENLHIDKKWDLAVLHMKKEKHSEEEECTRDKDVLVDDSSLDSTNITIATDKMDDSESVSSCLETSEQESVTECSEHTVASQSASADNVELEEILVSDSDSEVLLDEFREMESICGKGNIKCRSTDDDQDMAHKTKDFDLPTLRNPSIDDFRSYEDVKPSAYALTIKMEKDVKLVPKDDLSLELKDFVGFPSTKDEKYQRPHRMRRSIEQKDFIYENKRTSILLQAEEEDDKDSLSLSSTEKLDLRSGGRFSSRRRSLLLKTEGEDCARESCNGSSFQSTGTKKNERFSLPPKKSVDEKLAKSSGGEESSGERKVRFLRRKVEANPQGSEASRKNVEKVAESNASGSNAAVKKESPSSTRCSSRLKMAISPVPKKKKKEIFNAHILTNGQDQSSTVVTSKVKL